MLSRAVQKSMATKPGSHKQPLGFSTWDSGTAAGGSMLAEHSSSSTQGFQVIHSHELPTVFHMNIPHLCFAGGQYEKYLKICDENI